MRPFRRPEEALAIVRGRAARRQRRRLVAAAGIIAGVIVLLLAGLALRGGGDGGDDPAAPTVPGAPAPTVELVGDDTGLPDGFSPLGVVVGPAGLVTATGQAAGEQGRPNPVWRSGDGRAWDAPAADVFGPLTVTALAATPQRYVVAATAPDGASSILASTDASTWQSVFPLEAGDNGSSLFSAGERFYRTTAAGLQTSPDAASWTPATAQGGPLTGVRWITTTASGYLAVGVGADGALAGLWSSTDGVTFTPLPASVIPAVAGVVGVGNTALVAYRGAADEDCDAAAGPDEDCAWPISFAPIDVATGATQPATAPAFTSADPDPHLVTSGNGWLALARDGDEAAVWASPDGRSWGPSETLVPVAAEGPAAVAGGAPAVAVAGRGGGDPPSVALITS